MKSPSFSSGWLFLKWHSEIFLTSAPEDDHETENRLVGQVKLGILWRYDSRCELSLVPEVVGGAP